MRRAALQPIRVTEPEPVIGLVQGIRPGSKNEWYVSLALDKLEIPYIFQYQLGMVGIRGSQRIDFVCYTPFAKAVFVQGEYWHNNRTRVEDDMKHMAAGERFGNNNVIDLEGQETDTESKALSAVKKKVM